MDQRTRKLMTIHKALYPRDDVDRLYVSRKEGGRGLASIEDNVDASIRQLEDYIEKHDFAVPTDHRIKLKECEKKDKYLDLARDLKKTVEHAGDNYTNCNWCFWYSN